MQNASFVSIGFDTRKFLKSISIYSVLYEYLTKIKAGISGDINSEQDIYENNTHIFLRVWHYRVYLDPQWQLLHKFKINCNGVAHIWHSYLYLLTYQLQVALHDITVVSLLGPGGPGKKEDILKLLKLASRNMFPATLGSHPTLGERDKVDKILHIIVKSLRSTTSELSSKEKLIITFDRWWWWHLIRLAIGNVHEGGYRHFQEQKKQSTWVFPRCFHN